MEPVFLAYVLVDTASGDVNALRAYLSEQQGIQIAHPLVGPNDMLCVIQGDGFGGFTRVLNSSLREPISSGKIKHTETMLVFAQQFSGVRGDENTPAGEAAWVFIDIDEGDPSEVINELQKCDGVVHAHPVLGRFDIVAYIKGNTWEGLMKTIDNEIREINAIIHTDTRLVLMNKV